MEPVFRVGDLEVKAFSDGILKTSLDFLRTNPRPTEREIREGISAVLCRCTGYHGIVKAVAAAAPVLERR